MGKWVMLVFIRNPVDNFFRRKVAKWGLTSNNDYMKTYTHAQVINLLMETSPKNIAVLMTLEFLGEATTAQVTEALGADNSNTGRRLEALAEDGLVECVDDCHHTGGRGRPSRLWRLA